jgi:transposase InsO family protein
MATRTTHTSKDAYSTKELAELLDVTVMTVTRYAKRDGWKSRQRKKVGGGNEWLVVSMPEATRVAIQVAEARQCAEQLDREAVQAKRTAEVRQHTARAMADLTERERKRAEAKALVYRAWLDYARLCGLGRTAAMNAFCTLYNSGGAGLAITSEVRAIVKHISPNTVRSFGKHLRSDGLTSLAGVYGKHRRGTGIIESQPEVHDYVRGSIFEYPHISASTLLKGLRAELRNLDVTIPSKRTLQLWLQKWRQENPALELAIRDPDASRSRHAFALGNADHAIFDLNQRWEFDSTPGDVLLADGKRHCIVGCIDVYSRRAKVLVSKSSSSQAVCSLLRRCLLDWGVPEEAGTDNGSDYVSTRVTTALMDLNIRQDVAPPFTPEHKPYIERFFGTMLRDIFEVLEGYCGHNVAEAQAIRNRTTFAQRLFPKRVDEAGTVSLRLTPEELQAKLDCWCDDLYAMQPHGGLKGEFKGKTPHQMALEYTGPIRKVPDPSALDILLLPLAPGNDGFRTVTKKGVRLNGAEYFCEELALRNLVGQRVQVRLDEHDIRHVYLFDEDGVFIGRASDLTLPEVSREAVAMQAQRLQKAMLAEQKKEMRTAAKKMNVRSMGQQILSAAAEEATAIRQRDAEAQASVSAPILHTSPALMEASKAARVDAAPVAVFTPQQQADIRLGDTITKRTQRPACFADTLPEGPADRFKVWEELDAILKAGGELPSDQATWHRVYQTTSEFLGYWISKHGLPKGMNRRAQAVAR